MQDRLDIKILLGKRIKELRIKKGFTQEYLAELINVGQRNLSKIECGNNFVTSETLNNIVKAFNIEPEELFNFNHNKDKEILKKELLTAINNETVDIIQLYRLYKAIK